MYVCIRISSSSGSSKGVTTRPFSIREGVNCIYLQEALGNTKLTYSREREKTVIDSGDDPSVGLSMYALTMLCSRQ